MGYYETYEFLVIDRPLTPAEMRALRRLSTRATITPTRFYNFYDWGGLKGDPREMLRRYFDVFVYTGEGGARWGMLRLPTDRIDVRRWRTYLPEQRGASSPKWGASFVTRGAVTILTFLPPDGAELRGLAGEIAEDEALSDEGCWAAPLALLRADLLAGDVRGLYLAWLGLVQGQERRRVNREPPRPVGLTPLTGTLHAFAEFLRLDPAWLGVAAAERAAAPKPRGRRPPIAR
jgi:hypothetical protein